MWRGMKRMGTVAALLATVGTAAQAQQNWTLTFGPEANGATGTGSGLITLDGDLLRINLTFSGLSGTTTIAHIHCCTAAPFTGTAGVATRVPSFGAFPTGVTSGAYDRTFNLALNQDVADPTLVFWNPTFVQNNGGSTSAAASLLVARMNEGRAYFNIHTSTFGGGEIRAFTQAVVPEPSTYALLAVGLGGVALGARRRRATA